MEKMLEGKSKDRNHSQLSFHTLSEDSCEENESPKRIHIHEHRKTTKSTKNSRSKRSREPKHSRSTSTFNEIPNTHNIVNPFTKIIQHIQRENKLTYEISVQSSTKSSSSNASHSTITTPEYALSYANVSTQRKYALPSQENDIPKLVYEKDINIPHPESTKTTSGSERKNNNIGCGMDSNTCWMGDVNGFYEDFYENDDMISQGLSKSILGELSAIQGLQYPLRSTGFGSFTSSMTSNPANNGEVMNDGLGLNDVYREALNVILRNEFGKVDEVDNNRIDSDGNFEYCDDDYDGDGDDERADFLDYDSDNSDSTESVKNEPKCEDKAITPLKVSDLTEGEEEKDKEEKEKKKRKLKRKKEDTSFYYEVAGHSLLGDEDRNDEGYNPITSLAFSQRESALPLIPDLSKGSDSEPDEDIRFAFHARDEIEESIQLLLQFEEAEKVKRELEIAQKEISSQKRGSNSVSIDEKSDLPPSSSAKETKQRDDKSSTSTSTSTSPSSSVMASEASSDNDDDSISSDGKQTKKPPQKVIAKAKKYYIGKRCGSTLCKQSLIRDTNDNYLELKCSAGCKFYLHPRCSKKLDAVHKIENAAINYYNKLELDRNIDLSEAAAAAVAEAIAIKNAEAKAMPRLSKKSMKRKLRANGRASGDTLSLSTTDDADFEQADDEDKEEDGNDNNKDRDSGGDENDTKRDEKEEVTKDEIAVSQTKTKDEKEQNDKDKDKEDNLATKSDVQESEKEKSNELSKESLPQQQQTSETTNTSPTIASTPTSELSSTVTSTPKKKKKKKPKNGGAVNSPLTTPAQAPAPAPIQMPINNEWANADAILKIKNGPSGIPLSTSSSTTVTSKLSSTPSSASSTTPFSQVSSSSQSQQEQQSSNVIAANSSLLGSSPQPQTGLDRNDWSSLASMADVKMLTRNDDTNLSSQDHTGNDSRIDRFIGRNGCKGEYRNGGFAARKSIYSIFLPYDYGEDEKLIPLECPVWPEWSPLRSTINGAGSSFVVDLTESEHQACTDNIDFGSFFDTTFDEGYEQN